MLGRGLLVSGCILLGILHAIYSIKGESRGSGIMVSPKGSETMTCPPQTILILFYFLTSFLKTNNFNIMVGSLARRCKENSLLGTVWPFPKRHLSVHKQYLSHPKYYVASVLVLCHESFPQLCSFMNDGKFLTTISSANFLLLCYTHTYIYCVTT